MSQKLDRLTVTGFKSIKALHDFPLNPLNILIGANGAGKSNFIALFRLLRAIVDKNLQTHISEQGGADGFFFNGIKQTDYIKVEAFFGNNAHSFDLIPTADEKIVIAKEYINYATDQWRVIANGQSESNIDYNKDNLSSDPTAWYVYKALSNSIVYHFHDTSNNAPMRRSEIVQDVAYLRPDAANIAPFLLHLREESPISYSNIVDAIRLVTPFFDQFLLRPIQRGERETVNLSWQQRGSDYPMQPYQLSDGTLRFICLATALLQPNLPTMMVIDEPELGLHPYAIAILAELIQTASADTQLIISTQSPTLIDHFEPADIVVVNRENGASTFERLSADDLSDWLEMYTLGELWQKNIVAGGPVHE